MGEHIVVHRSRLVSRPSTTRPAALVDRNGMDITRLSTTPTPTVKEEIVVEDVPYPTSTTEDNNLQKGTSYISTAGVAGERTLRYAVTTLNGVEVSRQLVSDEITRQPVPEVTVVGTYVTPAAPPPPPQDSGCDENYADACVPIASDVDCASGSGNGPAYLSGTARVVGTDIYDLDRDGDGIACE